MTDTAVEPVGPFDSDEARAAAEIVAREHAEAIGAALDTLGAVDDEQGRAVAAASEFLRTGVTGPAGVDAAEGAAVAEITTDGHITDADLARLKGDFDAAGITADHMARLGRGEEVSDLPPGSVDFLKAYYEEAGVGGLMAVTEALGHRGGADAETVSAQLGDGLLTLSNERAGDVTGGRGGYAQLPDSVRAMAEGRPVPGNFALSPFSSNAHSSGISPSRMVMSDRFWNGMGRGSAAPGTGLGVKLITTASDHARLLDDPDLGGRARSVYDAELGGHLRSEDSGQSMLDIASRNHEAATRVLTGDLDGDASTPPVNRDEILNPLFRHEWGDGGAALGKNVDWMTDAMNDPGNRAEWERGGRASFGFAQYASHEDNYNGLMDMRGEHSENLGEVNPELVRGMEQGLRGTVGYLAGAAEAPSDMPGWGTKVSTAPAPLESDPSEGTRFDHAKRLATLLSTDHVADLRFGQETNRLLNEQLAETSEAASIRAGQLSGLTAHGEFEVQKEMMDDTGLSNQEAFDRRKENYDLAVDLVKDGAGLVPGLGVAPLGADVAAPALEQSIIGSDPAYDPDDNTAGYSGASANTRSMHAALTAAITSGRVTPEILTAATGLLDSEGNLVSATTIDEAATSAELTSSMRYVLSAAGLEFTEDHSSWFDDGYTNVRPLNIKE